MDQFVHLHVHTEYSMLDGAAKLGPLFATAEQLGQPAVAITDHGNMFGVHAFYKQASKTSVKPIIGIEAYVAPASRYHKKPVFWATGRNTDDESSESGDVSGRGAFTHMTMIARNATGLRNLFALSSLSTPCQGDRIVTPEHLQREIQTDPFGSSIRRQGGQRGFQPPVGARVGKVNSSVGSIFSAAASAAISETVRSRRPCSMWCRVEVLIPASPATTSRDLC